MANTLPTITSDLSKSSTVDILRNLQQIALNDWHVDFDGTECEACGAIIDFLTLPVRFNSGTIQTISEMFNELIKRENK